MLARIYAELDLVAEVHPGQVFAGLTSPQLAAVLASLVYEACAEDSVRGPRMPDARSNAAMTEVRRIWRDVSLVERDARLARGPEPDIGFSGPRVRMGGRPRTRVGAGDFELTAGDFVHGCGLESSGFRRADRRPPGRGTARRGSGAGPLHTRGVVTYSPDDEVGDDLTGDDLPDSRSRRGVVRSSAPHMVHRLLTTRRGGGSGRLGNRRHVEVGYADRGHDRRLGSRSIPGTGVVSAAPISEIRPRSSRVRSSGSCSRPRRSRPRSDGPVLVSPVSSRRSGSTSRMYHRQVSSSPRQVLATISARVAVPPSTIRLSGGGWVAGRCGRRGLGCGSAPPAPVTDPGGPRRSACRCRRSGRLILGVGGPDERHGLPVGVAGVGSHGHR